MPHGNTMQTALRIVQDLLSMKDCQVDFDFEDTKAADEDTYSPSYPEIRSVYRKEIVTGIVKVAQNKLDPKILARIGYQNGACSPFTVTDSHQYTRKYQWMSDKDRQQNQVKVPATRAQDDISSLVYPPVGLKEDELSRFLVDNNVELSAWGQGNNKSLREFSEELVKGEARLVKVPGNKVAKGAASLVRVVDIVVLAVATEDGKEVLIEAEEISGSEKVARNRLPAIKRRADEHMFLAAKRLITEVLDLPENSIDLHTNDIKVTEEQEESTSYQGLPTKYNKLFMTATWR